MCIATQACAHAHVHEHAHTGTYILLYLHIIIVATVTICGLWTLFDIIVVHNGIPQTALETVVTYRTTVVSLCNVDKCK